MLREKAHFEEREPILERILSWWRCQKVIKHIPQSCRVLDLGCGYNAKFLEKISGNISSGAGVDISVNPEFSNSKIHLIAHDLNEAIPFPDEEFDIVLSLANLEHLNSPQKALQEIRRVLKTNGILLLLTPSFLGKPVLEFLAFIGLVSQQEIQDHKHYFNKYSLLALCQQAGFSDCRHQYFEFGMNNFLQAKKEKIEN